MTFRVETFGCKVNQYDSQAMREDLLARGWREASEEADTDVVVVDTCSVTETAAREGLRRIRQLARRPGLRVVVTGCLVPSHRETLEAIPGIAWLVPTESKARLGETLHGESGYRHPSPEADGPGGPRPVWLSGDVVETFRTGITRFDGRSRAFVKVQDGCDLACAYCIVPKVRGRSRSRPTTEAVAEARRLVASGYQELVLTGIHLGAYGRDLPGRPRWIDLVDRLLQIPGRWRLRLSSIEANELQAGDAEALANFCERGGSARAPRLCPHVHLPLQSGSASVLRRMRRPNDPETFERTIASLRSRIPDLSITTDLLVGFPGETESDAQATREAVRRLGFCRVHAFPFSPRPGTEAAGMAGAIPASVVRPRMRALAEVARAAAAAFHRRFVGRSVEVLVEERPDRATGRPVGYSEQYLRVRLETGIPRGGLVAARVTSADAEGASAVAESRVRAPDPVSFAV